MKLTVNWLKEWITLTVTDPHELARRLTFAGIQVASVEPLSKIPASVVVARLLERQAHPNADRLSLCKVDDGTHTFAIVCGANNMKAGDYVALARVGSHLPNGVDIKRSKIRGEESEGMLCSAVELGLGTESDGIIILPSEASATKLGEPLIDQLGLNDCLMEIEITPNRGDCLSVLGIARELAALDCGRLKELGDKVPPAQLDEKIFVHLEANGSCPRYSALRLDWPENTPIAETPRLYKERLLAAGQQPIHLLVDLVNYVMLEVGQPMHAFDFDKLDGGKLVVRPAKTGEKFLGLDQSQRTLSREDLIIADAKQPQCLAGVMGAANSAVTPQSRRILIEAAHFTPMAVRSSSKRHQLSSESSYRFERFVDPEIASVALARFGNLLQACQPKVRFSRPHDVSEGEKPVGATILFRPERFTKLMGYALKTDRLTHHFKGVGVEILKPAETWQVRAPSWRSDLTNEADLIEEVARLEGYDKIPQTLPATQNAMFHEVSHLATLRNLRSYLTGHGFLEAVHLSFGSAAQLQSYGLTGVPLKNPLGEEQGVLRPSLVPALIKSFTHHLNHLPQRRTFRLFEINTVFKPFTQSPSGVEERLVLTALAWQGEQPSWRGKLPPTDFYWASGIVEGLVKILSRGEAKFDSKLQELLSYMHPKVVSNVKVKNKLVGWLGLVHPGLLPATIGEPVALIELDLTTLLAMTKVEKSFRETSAHPVMERDIALIFDAATAAGEALEKIRKCTRPLLIEAQLIDQFVGGAIPAGKKSLAFRLAFQAADRTLKDEEVDPLVRGAVDLLQSDFGAKLRSV